MTTATAPPSGPDQWLRSIMRAIGRLAIYVGLIWGGALALGRLKAVIVALVVAAVLAYIMRPMAGWLVRQRWFQMLHGGRLSRHALRVCATFYVLVALFVGGWYSAVYLFSPFVIELRNASEHWPEYRTRLLAMTASVTDWYSTHVSPEWRAWLARQWSERSSGGGMGEGMTGWLGESVKHANEAVRSIVEIVLLPVLAFYFALDSKRIKFEFVALVPRRARRHVLRLIRDFNGIMYSFVVGQAILCLIAGVVVGIGLAALGVSYPLTLGLLAGFTRAIPIIGPIIGGIPIVLLALVTKDIGVALGVLGFFSFLHFAESKFIMPMLIGERMNLHPVVIIVVLLIGQEYGGLLGMFFAAPIAALMRIVVQRYWLRSPACRQPRAGAAGL